MHDINSAKLFSFKKTAPEFFPFVHPPLQHPLYFWALVILAVLNQLCQHLQPVDVSFEVNAVNSLYFMLKRNNKKGLNFRFICTHCKFTDDGTCPPTMLQSDVGKITVRVVTEVEHLLPIPASHVLKLLNCALELQNIPFISQLKSFMLLIFFLLLLISLAEKYKFIFSPRSKFGPFPVLLLDPKVAFGCPCRRVVWVETRLWRILVFEPAR